MMSEEHGLAPSALDPALAERLRRDPHRPRYHFVPPAHWMNDPNGLLQWRGQYHLFYQHHPFGPLWANMHWGHAVSDDLVRWRHLPIALAPTPDSPDQDGCFSGCAVDDNGTPTLVYTGVRGNAQRVCLATGDADLLRWRKHPDNPVIPAPPPDLDLVAYRDPNVFRWGDWWWMVHGAGLRGVGGAALLYRSRDLVNWEHRGPLIVGDQRRREPIWTGSMWECPQLIPLGDRHVLIYSVWHERATHYAAYITGRLDGERLIPEREGILDPGAFYAPQAMRDDQGRWLLFGWLREAGGREAMLAAGWSGVMSLPRALALRPDGTVGYVPAPEVERLRGPGQRLTDLTLPAGELTPLDQARGDCLEIRATFEPGEASGVVLVVRRSPDGAEETRIIFDGRAGHLRVDRARSSLSAEPPPDTHPTSLRLASGEPLELRVFLDRSVIEVFANGRACLSERVYPTRADSLEVGLMAVGGTALSREIEIWPMRSIWPDQ